MVEPVAPACERRADVRHYLEISSSHLPERICAHLDRCPGVLSWGHDLGSYVYVPNDGGEFQDTVREGAPPEVLLLMQFAMGLGCSLIDLRRDVEIAGDLPVYEGDTRVDNASPPPAPPVPGAVEPSATDSLPGPPPGPIAVAASQSPTGPPGGLRRPPPPPPGWYPDPHGRARLRWWDGTSWTFHQTD